MMQGHTPRTIRKPCRAGYSLIELVTVISMLSALMMASAGLFVTLMRAERNTGWAISEQQTLARLALQFRRDVHQAQTAAKPEDANGLILNRPSSEPVQYRILAEGLERIASINGKPHREVFRLRNVSWNFESPSEQGTSVSLVVTPTVVEQSPSNASAAEMPTRSWRIAAELMLTPPAQAMAGGTP